MECLHEFHDSLEEDTNKFITNLVILLKQINQPEKILVNSLMQQLKGRDAKWWHS